MASAPYGPLAAGLCFLMGAATLVRGWSTSAGRWFGAGGAAILAGALAARGLRAGRWPLTSGYEFALAFALTTVVAALALEPTGRQRQRHFGASLPGAQPSGQGTRTGKRGWSGARPAPATVTAIAMLLAAAMIAYARFGIPAFKQAPQPLPPALDSIWLPLHVGSAALAYGTLAVAGAAGLAWLVFRQDRNEAEVLLARGVAGGYPLLTLSLIFGMIWAEVAWGRYWGWDLKEVWTLTTWLVYTLYWHLRQRPRWQGRRMSWLALAGLGAVLFTFLGVGWLAPRVGLESLHLF